ncbi:phage tail tape measure protein [Anaeromusa sp.]|uniref:phage tail tape measure protein n=1 Tax=Anaeromusa sp. TaxID=1872520 RepID=UPI0026220779|nr:phage tail tape measure protein [Anaeromusa sp.]MDD3158400.1 phage tail tape measure protein [Anaeromusa sp.]
MMANKIFEVAFNILGNVNGSFNAAFSTAAERMSRLNTNVSSLKTQIRDLERAQQGSAGITLEQAAALSRLRDQLVLAEAAQQRYARALSMRQRAEKVQSMAGNVAMGAAAMGGAMFSGPVMASMNFETSMAQVAKQVDNARDANGELSDIGREAQSDILEMSQTLMKSPVEVANAYALGARAGVKGTENLKKITEMGIMMGTAFEMPAEQVTTSMAKIGNALGYNLETAEGIAKLEALADTINYVDDQTLATGTDLIDFMTRTAGTITALAPTMSEAMTVGLGAGLLAAGERSETAATAINALMTKLAAAPTQAKSFQVALAQVGMSAEELQASMIEDADSGILNLFTRINELDQATRNNVLADLIGQEHIDTITKLTGNYDKFIDAIQKGNDEAAKGSVRKEFEIMSQTTARQMEGVKAAFERTFIALGNNLLPVVQSIGGALVSVLEKVQAFTKEYPNLTNVLMVGSAVVLGLGVALGGAVWAIAGVVSSAATLYTTVAGLNLATKLATAAQWLWNAAMIGGNIAVFLGRMASYWAVLGATRVATLAATAAQWLWNAALTANPIGLVIAGVGALAAASYYLYENWDVVKAFFVSLWDSPAATLLAFAAGPIGALVMAGSFLVSNWETVKSWFSLLWNDPGKAVDVFVQGMQNKFATTFAWLGEKWAWAKALLNGDVPVANASPAAAPDEFADGAGEAATTVDVTPEFDFPDIGQWADEACTSVADFASNAYQSLCDFASDSYNTVADFFSALPGQIAYGIGYAVGFLFSLPERIAQFTTEAAAAIDQWSDQCYASFLYWAELTARTVVDWALQTYEAVVDWANDTYQAMVDWLPQAYATFTQWISNTITDAAAFFFSLPGLTEAALTSFAANIESWASGVYNSVVNWFSQIPNAIADAFNQAGNFIDNLWNKASSFADSLGMNFKAGFAAGSLPGHATGGIFSQEHIARFAEGNRPEAVIPLDGSSRAISIWETAGNMMGLFNRQDERTMLEEPQASVFQRFVNQGDTQNQTIRQGDTTIQFSPIIHVTGGGDTGSIKESVTASMREAMDDLERRIEDIQRRKERLSYG